MDNIGDWLYFVMAIGAIVVSFFGKSKKKEDIVIEPNPKNLSKENRTNKTTWEEIFRELKNMKEDAGEFSSPYEDTETAKPELSTTVQTVEPSVPISSHYQSVAKHITPTSSFSFEDEISNEKVETETADSPAFVNVISDLEDMKKAVIYSEILNRKYN